MPFRVSSARVSSLQVDECNSEIDSHADTSVFGKCALVVHDYGEPVNVVGWNPEAEAQVLQTVSAAVKYTHPVTGKRYILVFHQVIHHPELEHHLLCPMQMRMQGIGIDETPKFLAKDPTDETFAVTVPLENDDESLIIPLGLRGVTAYFPVSKPSVAEYEDESIPKIDMTEQDLPWEPHSSHFMESEAAMTDFKGRVTKIDAPARGRDRVINAIETTHRVDEGSPTSDYQFMSVLKNNVHVSSVDSRKRGAVNPDDLVKRWKISPRSARQTVKHTTCRMKRTVLHPSLSRRFRTNDRALRYRRVAHDVYSDTLFSSVRSWRRGNRCAQVFGTRFGWCRAYPMKSKGDAHEALSTFFQQVGVPPVMIVDGSKEQIGKKFSRKCQEAQCRLKQTEPYTPKSNAAEGTVKEVKKGSKRLMIASRAPKPLWDQCLELQGLISSHTAKEGIFALGGEVPETIMNGETADISQICEFQFYQWVMFRDEIAPFPEDDMILGRWLGPAIDIGPAMTAKILKCNGEIVHRSTFRELTQAEWESEDGKEARRLYDEAIHHKLGQPSTDGDFEDVPATETPAYDFYRDDDPKQQPKAPDAEEKPYQLLMGEEGTVDAIPTPEMGDEFLNASIMLPRGSGHCRGKVVSRKRDEDGNPIGRRSDSGHLVNDTRMYLVEFPDGEVTELTANTIATTMYANCDDEGNEYMLLESILDWRKNDDALSLEQQVGSENGKKFWRRSTAGVELCCKWRDGTTSYQPLSLLKESHPVETAEFAVAMGIEDEPAFNWWVKPVLKKRDRIISAVKKRQGRYLKKRYKFGIRVPKDVDEAYDLDKANGDTFWADAIAKELKNIRVAFKILGLDEKVPIGYQEIKCFFIFDVKMEDLRRKARLVCGGHVTEAPAAVTYSTVVSRETVRIALTLAALNDLKVKSGDIQNAYITAPCQEKIWTVLGPEWGADAGKKAILVRAAYGLRSSGAAFRNHLASCMRHLGYSNSKADPDLWMRKEVKPEYAGTVKDAGDDNADEGSSRSKKRKRRDRDKDDSHKYYYSYILCYVDDILCIHHDPEPVLQRLDKYFQFKPGSVGDPDFYLGSKLKMMELEDGTKCWGSSPSKYVQEAVSNVEAFVKEQDDQWKLPKVAANPFKMGYEPELDTTPELNPELASYYMSQIGVLRWIVEIGRIDIATEVSLLSSHVAMPREGHLEALLHVFAHIRQKHNSRLAYDPSYPKIDQSMFKQYDWAEQYHGAEEPIPEDAPEALGKPVDLRLYVDSDHAGEKLTRRSRTGWMIYMQNALIAFHSKRQSTVETSVFGAEFCAMKSGIEALRGIRYKLRMMGVPLTGPSYIFGDNMSVIHNTQRPESTLKKKSCSVAYHFCREAVAMGECLTCHIPTARNPADLLTKVLYGNKRVVLVRNVLYDIYD